MTSMKRIVYLFLFILIVFSASAQDQINMLNGKIIEGKVIDYDSNWVSINVIKRKKSVNRVLERSRVFSIIDSSRAEKILYIRDSTIGNAEPLEYITYFVIGEQDAYANFKPHWCNIGGFAFGLGVSMWDTYKKNGPFMNGFFQQEPGFVHLLSPFVYTIIASIPGITFKLSKISDRSFLLEESYRDGFGRIVKIKRRFGGLKFSLLGSASGVGLYFLAKGLK